MSREWGGGAKSHITAHQRRGVALSVWGEPRLINQYRVWRPLEMASGRFPVVITARWQDSLSFDIRGEGCGFLLCSNLHASFYFFSLLIQVHEWRIDFYQPVTRKEKKNQLVTNPFQSSLVEEQYQTQRGVTVNRSILKGISNPRRAPAPTKSQITTLPRPIKPQHSVQGEANHEPHQKKLSWCL